MKAKNQMVIVFKSLEDLGRDAIKAIKTKAAKVQPANVVYFDSWTSFRNFMSLQKLEILTMISSVEPKSIYELTRLLERSLSAVQKDCESLEQAGFITLEKQKTGRGQVVPRLKFKYDKIVVRLPQHPYELIFKAAA
ncbi:HVO_A0114 family putative DNA-binding protein [Bdellovibrio sp. BCCA]|uniref:HVO_A0114 family putative DNA-binding protein n=1 Tax=Bdellovibrio sp. BCCA TaxID=3136281 RepID=UPI0030F04A45